MAAVAGGVGASASDRIFGSVCEQTDLCAGKLLTFHVERRKTTKTAKFGTLWRWRSWRRWRRCCAGAGGAPAYVPLACRLQSLAERT